MADKKKVVASDPLNLFRNLTTGEIDTLQKRGCSARNWSGILVKDGFSPGRVSGVVFSGTCALGSFNGTVDIEDGVLLPCGISNAMLHNCVIGNDVYISNVPLLSNYDVADCAVIVNVNTLAVSGETTFGNGVIASVINENGGRPLTLTDRTTAQTAYLQTLYRHNTVFIAALEKMTAAYIDTRRSKRGTVGYAARIRNCNTIRNVEVGPFARIDGALNLEEGTIASERAEPTVVGSGVVARNFIFQSGAQIDSAAIINSSLAGQQTRIGRQFSAENSVFFANSEMFHGESASVFAGPCSVSHHKGTLLIGGYLSFYNAGSATNMSNHKYKVGPMHQGIMERGVKTGSSSYVLWPSRIGAFSTVIGRHFQSFDTRDFPFSLINEENGRTTIHAGMNLLSIGVQRDARKWRSRDRRCGMNRFDMISFDMLSPYTVGRILKGLDKLTALQTEESQSASEYAVFDGVRMKRTLIKNACTQYENAVTLFIGEQLYRRLQTLPHTPSLLDLRKLICPSSDSGTGPWIDVCGMLTPQSVIDTLVADITVGSGFSVERLRRELARIHGMYDQLAWNWCADLIQRRLGLILHEITPSQLIDILSDWTTLTRKVTELILIDADKEFSDQSMTGYGIDGDAKVQQADFTAVRGTFNSTAIVQELRQESDITRDRTARLVGMLETVK